MSYSEWLRQIEPRYVRIVRGGSAEVIASQTVDDWQRSFVFFVDRPLATLWSARLSMRSGPKIELRISRGLAQNLKDLALQRGETAAFMHGELFRRDLVSEAKRLAQAMLAIAGYDTPAAVIEALLFSQFATKLRQFAARATGQLVIHDDAMFLPDSGLGELDPFSAGPATAIDLGTIPGVLDPAARIDAEHVVKHAEFLARRDMATLQRMHDFLIGTRVSAAFDHWRQMFADAARTPGYELFVQLGTERLNDLEAAMVKAAP